MRIDKAVVDRCTAEITRDIIAGIYQPGDQLPPIARLAQVYGVPRAVIEKALQALCLKNTLFPAENNSGARQVFKVTEKPPGSDEPSVLEEKYLTVKEVAAVLRVSKMTVYRLIDDKEIESKTIGRRTYRIPERAVRDYLRSPGDS